MKEKYKKRIYEFSEKLLRKLLDNKINNIFTVPYKVDEVIKDKVINTFLLEYESIPELELGNKLQPIGKIIAEKLIDETILECLEDFKEQLNSKNKDILVNKENFYNNKIAIQNIDNLLKELKYNVLNNKDVYDSFWSEADVIITPERMSLEDLAWNHQENIQLVTKTKSLANKLSYLFENVREIMLPLLDHNNKYYFYGELAICANESINKNFNDEEIIDFVLLRVSELNNEFQKNMADYFSSEFDELGETIENMNNIKNAEEFIHKYKLSK